MSSNEQLVVLTSMCLPKGPGTSSFHFIGTPVPQSRPRARLIKGKVRFYEAKRSRLWKEQARECVKEVFSLNHEAFCAPLPLYPSGPLRVAIQAQHGIGKHQVGPNMEERVWRATKPDIDNITKCVLDAFNGLLWTDDAQIAKLDGEHFTCEGGRSLVTVEVGEVGSPFMFDGDAQFDDWKREVEEVDEADTPDVFSRQAIH